MTINKNYTIFNNNFSNNNNNNLIKIHKKSKIQIKILVKKATINKNYNFLILIKNLIITFNKQIEINLK